MNCLSRQQFVIDFGSATVVSADFSYPMSHFRNIWITGVAVNNPSAETLRLKFDIANVRAQNCLTNALGGSCIYVPAGVAGQFYYHDFNHPIPLLDSGKVVAPQFLQGTFEATSSTGGAVTFTRLTVYGFLEKAPADERILYNPKFFNVDDQVGFGG